MSFSIRDMNYILVIAEEKNITSAAKRLNKYPSSLNRCVKKIEEELDISLFRKTENGLEVTTEGRAYLSAASDIMGFIKTLQHV